MPFKVRTLLRYADTFRWLFFGDEKLEKKAEGVDGWWGGRLFRSLKLAAGDFIGLLDVLRW